MKLLIFLKMSEYGSAVVIDTGSGFSKVGLAGEKTPKSVFPTIVGKPRHESVLVGSDQTDTYVGNEAQSKRGILNISYPIQSGIATNFYDMTKVWEYIFKTELGVASEEHPVLVAETPLTPKENRQKMAHVSFLTFI